MKQLIFVSLLLLFSASALFADNSGVKAVSGPEGVNLALGKKYTLSAPPEYSYCTDPGDAVQLTDGQTTKDYFWTQKGTLGWTRAAEVAITIDLGKVEPIDRVAFTSAAGVAGVTWPLAAVVLVSDDGKEFRNVGEIVTADARRNGPFDNTKYRIRKIVSDPLQTKGRFVRLVLFTSGQFLFTDEVEVFRGEDTLLAKPVEGPVVASLKEMAREFRITSILSQRFSADIQAINAMIADAVAKDKLNDLTKNLLLKRTETLRSRLIKEIPQGAASLKKTVFPLSATHAELFGIQANLWKTAGGFSFQMETVNRWELFPVIGRYPADNAKNAEVSLLRGEKRAFAVNLYNAEEEPVDLVVRLIPQSKQAVSPFEVSEVPWTDTNRLTPVQAALVNRPVKDGKSAVIRVQPGLVTQLWVRIDATKMQAGEETAELLCETTAGKKLQSLTVQTKVYPFDFPEKTTLMTGGWDYTSQLPCYNVTEKNIDSFLKVCREYHINAPWARPGVAFQYKLAGKPLKLTVDTKEMENWLKQWPDATEYFIFLSVGSSFGSFKVGSKEFDDWVGEWSVFWRNWFKERKIDPKKVSLLVVDEPGMASTSVLTNLIAWAKAIKKAAPEFNIWEDPVYTPPTKMPAELIEVSDTLCPNRPQWLARPDEFRRVYSAAQQKGKTLHFYSCSGPVRLLDPYNYFLLQAWHCWQQNAKASFFWAMGDGSGVSSWMEYAIPRNAYCPMFIDPEEATVVPAKQLAAIGESVQDYETLLLLQTAMKKAANQPEKKEFVRQAGELLDRGVSDVLQSPGTDKIEWSTPTDRNKADVLRKAALELLLKLQ